MAGMVVERTAMEKVMVERVVSNTGTVGMGQVVEVIVGMITVTVVIKLMIMVVMMVVETIRGMLVMAEVLMKVILLLL